MNILIDSQVWVLFVLWVIATIFFIPKAWKQHTGGATKLDVKGNPYDVDPIPFGKTTYFLFWLAITVILIGFGIWIVLDYL